ncbi:MFS transporter [Mesorhizobium sp. B2-2-4]|uniref:MFS transporter n=1 Tax=unclassified Mesorhizobium TaxID=325217 RepID=UPI00112D0C7D|nr:MULTISPECIES: MFS transporter [unclassified Mesorhizobium]TPL46126.1 MFS transporter [Mesorhizobium sp. B2-4-4]TPM54185.1 MFS transporter [Mesorhizobium sp. B2-2-4]TPM64593.1 MFS transporter [Mesorhizobium sp. B2-2-1]TPN10492.1 MFS transporter [Mesorhizobium sp. B2-1-3]TPN69632.1 MFS transporter [Mesorhizobium sp. B1-1-3]
MNRTIPLILAVALFMENMDSTVIATSLPAIALDIHTSPIALKLALTSYLVSLAIFIPISGWMADRFGAKNVFRAAIAVFIVGSVACAVSGSLPAFVVSRFLQGIGGAMMTPVGRLVLVRATPKSELVAAMSWLTVPALVGPLVGPPIGGFITTYFTWHWIFLINVPIGLIGIWLATRFLPETESMETPPLDFVGFVLSGLAASGVVFGLSVISLPYLPPATGFITVGVGLVSGALYLMHARRARNPLLALDLFRNQVFRSSVLGGGLFRIGIGAVPFLLPLMFQIGFGLTPFQSGMITFVSAIGAIGMKFVTALIFRVVGFRRVLIVGSLVAAASIAVNGLFTPDTPYLLMLAMLLVGGFIRSMFFTGINALAYAEVSAEDTSKATPIAAVFQQLSIALGVAVAGGILEISTSIHGGPLTLPDFHTAFFIVAAISAAASLSFMRLAPDAGNAVSGHGRLTMPKPLEPVRSPGE